MFSGQRKLKNKELLLKIFLCSFTPVFGPLTLPVNIFFVDPFELFDRNFGHMATLQGRVRVICLLNLLPVSILIAFFWFLWIRVLFLLVVQLTITSLYIRCESTATDSKVGRYLKCLLCLVGLKPCGFSSERLYICG